jgi:septal ring factor EnvC (AmiA/AmiB activator)
MPRARRNRFLPPVALALLLAGTALAEPPERPTSADAARRQADEAERAHAAGIAAQKEAAARAAAAEQEADRLADERIAAAARLRAAERATEEAANRMDTLAHRRQEAAARLQARADELAPLLPVIERMSLYPAETLLAVEAQPEAALRGVLVLQGIGRTLERQARELRKEQAALAAADQAMAAEAPKLAAAQAAQAAQAAELDRQIAAAQVRRDAASDQAEEFARQAAKAAARAETLRGVIDQLEAERKRAEAKARSQAARAERRKRPAEASAARRQQEALASPAGGSLASVGKGQSRLTAPVAGTLVRDWGDKTDAGPATGLSYQAPPGARVVAPCGGRAVFAAPFRSFGLLIILDCGGGYHVVLAGLDRLDVAAGSPVRPGEPVGVMPTWDPHTPGNRPSLYVQLRHGGRPIDPSAWLKARS